MRNNNSALETETRTKPCTKSAKQLFTYPVQKCAKIELVRNNFLHLSQKCTKIKLELNLAQKSAKIDLVRYNFSLTLLKSAQK